MRLIAVEPDMAANVGAMLRVCACFAASFEAIEPCGFPFSARAVRRVGLDYAAGVPIRRHDSWAAFLAAERAATPPARLALLTTRGETPLWDWRFQPGDAVLVGRESAGVSDVVRDAVDARLRIPLADGARSLNVAVAAAIALAEARRQLGWDPRGGGASADV